MLTEIPSFTVIAEGSKTQGSVSFCSQCIILGIIEGNVYQQAQEPLALGQTGWIHGDITSQGPVTLAGRVEGNVFSSVKITVNATAHITGALVCPKIEIKPGAILESDILMRWSPESAPRKLIAA